jgi:hypothetical protein
VFDFMPHVRVIRDFAELKGALAHALGEGFDAAKARRDGRRFLAAMAACSFDLADFNYLKPDVAADAIAEDAMNALVRSVESGGASRAAASPAEAA